MKILSKVLHFGVCTATCDHVGVQGPCCSWGHTGLCGLCCHWSHGDFWPRAAAESMSGSVFLLPLGSVMMSRAGVTTGGNRNHTY